MTLKVSRIFYISVWAVLVLYVFLTEADVLPRGYVARDASLEYTLHLFCVLFTLGGTWTALRLFNGKKIRHTLTARPHLLPHYNFLRTGILASAIVLNVIVYYALDSSATPLYCLLVTLIGLVFCWPKDEVA